MRLLDDGVDPSISKKQAKASLDQNTFESVATEWFEKQSSIWSKGHADKVWQTFKSGAFPHLRSMTMSDIRSSDVLHVVKKIEEPGALDVAARVKQRISSVFRYAIQVGYAEYNPVDALRDVLKTRKVQ